MAEFLGKMKTFSMHIYMYLIRFLIDFCLEMKSVFDKNEKKKEHYRITGVLTGGNNRPNVGHQGETEDRHFKCMENRQKFEKLTKVAKNLYLEAQKLLRIYDLRLDSC